ncbi:MAG: arginine repressor [Chloroflexota bacterium]|jgi:transcriptional regulator of arginine metabolism
MARNGTSELLKRARQQAIADVVRDRRLRTQRELVAALKDKGFSVTQATVSRDISEMGLRKIPLDGVHVYALPAAQAGGELGGELRLRQLLRDLPIDVHESGTMLVIRAVPGTAHAIAAALDRADWSDVLGTIAGDDTLFVACADEQALPAVKARLLRLGQ